ncbi:MAG: diguanylate cyclase domain-containing protein [Gammaproteobacteria bacterium]
MFLGRLEQAIHKFQRTHRKLTLMFLDLDYDKDINDTLGLDIGDLWRNAQMGLAEKS